MPVLAPRQRPDFQTVLDVVDHLADYMRAARANAGLTVKTQAAQVGVTVDTLARLDTGSNVTRNTILACLAWLAINA